MSTAVRLIPVTVTSIAGPLSSTPAPLSSMYSSSWSQPIVCTTSSSPTLDAEGARAGLVDDDLVRVVGVEHPTLDHERT